MLLLNLSENVDTLVFLFSILHYMDDTNEHFSFISFIQKIPTFVSSRQWLNIPNKWLYEGAIDCASLCKLYYYAIDCHTMRYNWLSVGVKTNHWARLKVYLSSLNARRCNCSSVDAIECFCKRVCIYVYMYICIYIYIYIYKLLELE